MTHIVPLMFHGVSFYLIRIVESCVVRVALHGILNIDTLIIEIV